MDLDLLLPLLKCPACGGEEWDASIDPAGVLCRTCSSLAPVEAGVLRLCNISPAGSTSSVFDDELADWEANAQFYLHEVESPLYRLLLSIKMATYRFPSVPPSLVFLDLGGGTGYFTSLVTGLGHRVVTLDFAASMLELGAKEYGLPAPVHALAGRLPFRNGCFDGVIANGVLHHCKAQEALSATCQEIHRVIKPDGLLLVFDRNGSFLGSNLHKLVMKVRHGIQTKAKFAGSASTNEPDFNDADLAEVLASGFQIAERRYVSTIPFFVTTVLTNTIEYAGFRQPANLLRRALAPVLSVMERALAVKSLTVEQCLRLTCQKIARSES